MTYHVDIVEGLKTLPDAIAAEVEGLSEEELGRKPDGEWSIKEVCGHLLDDSLVWRQRLRMMITQADPILPRYEQESLVAERGYQQAEFASILGQLRAVRVEIAEMLSALPRDGWKRIGRHQERGRLNIRQAMEWVLEHQEIHLRQIREVKSRVAAAAQA
ncbi:MAG: DinB family protein [Dehalococcoidia bacterium]|nr:DinB family protein [Dehalococcoidia bacterium]